MTKEKTPKKYKKLVMPDKIPDTPKNIIKSVFNTPPKKPSEWKYNNKRAKD